MAGYADFLRGRQTQAQSFLSSGNLNYNPLPVTGSNTTGCQDSTGCASGWACIGGICVKEESSSQDGSGNLSGCGSGGVPGGPNQCGAGTGSFLTLDKDFADFDRKIRSNLKPGDVLVLEGINGGRVGDGEVGLSLNGKCLKTGCSGSATPLGTRDVCCGKGRCCRMGSVVQCFCGDCPEPPQRCSKFCTLYQASNGQPAAGCSGENTCDECANCVNLGNFAGTACQKKGGGGPCWCGEGAGRNCTICEKCVSDGTCESDRDNCYPSPPDRPDPDPGPGPQPDPCAGLCTTLTVCGNDPDPECPPYHTCRQSGTITVGGETCRLFEQCDKQNAPEECGFCDCNCDNDCPDCQICDTSGKCVDDPACRVTCCPMLFNWTRVRNGVRELVFPCGFVDLSGYGMTATAPSIECETNNNGTRLCTVTADVSYYPTEEDCEENTNLTTVTQTFSGGGSIETSDWQPYPYNSGAGSSGKCVPDPICESSGSDYYHVMGFYDTYTYSWGEQQQPGCVRCLQLYSKDSEYRETIVSFGGSTSDPNDLGPDVTWVPSSTTTNPGQCPGRYCGNGTCSDSYQVLFPQRSDGSSAGQSRLAPGNILTTGGPGGNFRTSRIPIEYLQFIGFGSTPLEAFNDASAQEPSITFELPANPPSVPPGC